MLLLVLFLAVCEFALAFPKLPGSSLLPWKRNVFEERQAEAQPTCACASVDPPAAAFIGYAPFAAAASAAPTPSGYVNAFTNENTYYSAGGGLGFTILDTYDSDLCATLCESVESCTAFTLYYEQDATYEGTDIASSASIKCAFWAGSVSPSGSSNRASETYNAIIAGSNGYTSNTVTSSSDTEPSNVASGSVTASASVSAISNAGPDQVSSEGSSSWDSTWPQRSHEGPAGGYPTSSPVSTTTWSPGGHGGPPGDFPTSSISTTSWSRSGHGGSHGNVSTSSSASTTSWSQTGHGGPYGGIPPPSSVFTSTSAGVGPERGSQGGDRSWTSEHSTIIVSTKTAMPVSVFSATSSTTTSHGRETYTHSTTTWSHSSSRVEPTHSSTTSRSLSSTTSHSSSISPDHSSTTSSSTTSLGTYTHSLTTSSHLSITSNTTPHGPHGFSATIPSGRSYWPTTSSSSSTTTRSHSLSSTSITTSSSSSRTSSTTRSTVAEPKGTSSPNGTYGGNSTPEDGHGNFTIPSIFLNSTHLIYNATTNKVYCTWTGQWYPYTANFSLASLNLTSEYGSNYTLPTNITEPVNATSISSSGLESPTPTPPINITLPLNTTSTSSVPSSTSPSATQTPTPKDVASSTNATGNYTGLPSGYNLTDVPWHMIYNPSNNSWYCKLTQQWYSAGGNFSLSDFNFTIPSDNTTSYPATNGSLPLNTATPDNSTSASSTVTTSSVSVTPTPDLTGTTSSVSATSTPDSPAKSTTNSTGIPTLFYNGTYPCFNSSHLFCSTNGSVYCDITEQWYLLNDTSWLSLLNFTLPSYNVTLNSTYPAINGTTTSADSTNVTSTSSSTTSSVSTTPTPDSSANSSTTNSTGVFTYPCFNSSHLLCATNGSVYCDITQQWYSLNDTSWLSLLNFTLPSYNTTGNSSYPIANTTTSSVIAEPTSTESTNTSSSVVAEPTATASNATGYPAYNLTGGFNPADLNSSHLIYSASNNSIFCTITGLWYPAGNFSLVSFNWTANYTADSTYGLNYTISSNTTDEASSASTSVEPSSATSSSSSDLPSATPAPNNSSVPLNTTSSSYPSYYLLPFNASHMIYSPSNNSFYCELTKLWYPAGNVSDIPGFNMSTISIFNGTLPSYNVTIPSSPTIPDNSTAVNATSTSPTTGPSETSIPAPDTVANSTTNSTDVYPSGNVVLSSAPVSSATTSSSQAPTPTPLASSNATVANSTDSSLTYNGTYVIPGFNSSALNSSHLIFAINGSVYCDYTQQWYLPNDTSWLALLNSTYLGFNASTYEDDNSSTYSVNLTSSSATEPSATSTNATSSFVGTATPAPSPAYSSDNSTTTNSTGVFPQTPSFNTSALNSTDHLIFYTNGSVWCDYTQKLYAANDTSWLSLVNYTSSAYNASAYGDTNTTEVNATSASTTSSLVDTATPTPSLADLSDNTTVTNSTGIFPQTKQTFNISALNSTDHLIFYPNGSVWCDYTQALYAANDTSWLSLLNYTSAAYNSSSYTGFNSTGYSLNSTNYDVNSTSASATSATSSTIQPTATPTSTPDTSNATVTNSTGVEYNSTLPSFNSTDHLIFYPNGSVWCDYTQELYAPNDTSWISLLNYTIPGYNASAGNYGTGYSLNSTAYGLNSTSVNATSDVSATSTVLSSSEPTATATPNPVANPSVNSTSSSNATVVYPQYNVTIPSFNPSILNSTDHLIFFANGSVWCDYTQTLYPANDTSWLSLFNATSSAFNVSAYGGFNNTGDNSTDYSYNATSLILTTPVANATSSVSPADNSTSTANPVANSTDTAANVTAPTNSTGIYPSYNETLTSLFNSSVINSTDHLIFYANGSVWCDYTQTLYPANDTSWESLLYPSSNSTGYSYNATGGFNASAYSYDVPALNSTAPADNSTLVEPSATSIASSSSDSPTPTPTPTPALVDNSTTPANVTGVHPSSNDTGIFPSYGSSAIVNTTADLIFYANGSVWCDYTQQLYPANDTSWESLVAALANSTGAGYAPTNVTGAGYVPTNLTGAGYADSSTESSTSAASIPAPAQVASPMGYAAPTAAPYSNATSSSTETDTSTDTADQSAPEATKVRRWKAPEERFRVR